MLKLKPEAWGRVRIAANGVGGVRTLLSGRKDSIRKGASMWEREQDICETEKGQCG